MARLKSNKYLQTPQDILDLHGYTLQEAEDEVYDFLNHAQGCNYRFVRIITGKGEVLRPWLEDYLFYRQLRYRSAKPQDGGDGALEIFF